MTADANRTDNEEEPDLPERFTKSELQLWADSRNKRELPPTNQHHVECDKYGILHDSEQHQQGLSTFMKRCRRDIILKRPRPDLTQMTSSRMPAYLQDIQRFNPELMKRIHTSEHCTLPTKSIIEDEKRVIHGELKKPWHQGLVLRQTANLIDPSWGRDRENQFVEKIQRKTKEKSAHVLMGVLQQWRKSQERKASPMSPQPRSTPDNGEDNDDAQFVDQEEDDSENKTQQEQTDTPIENANKSELLSVPEEDEIDQEDGILRHGSR
uniref:uncharacterized protein LOC120341609 n=1 Tax=Styela clava TaxID=7725 RepID=UPI00193A5D8B|nr:uncharacterized protein LOC120341609 [Styela clava]